MYEAFQIVSHLQGFPPPYLSTSHLSHTNYETPQHAISSNLPSLRPFNMQIFFSAPHSEILSPVCDLITVTDQTVFRYKTTDIFQIGTVSILRFQIANRKLKIPGVCLYIPYVDPQVFFIWELGRQRSRSRRCNLGSQLSRRAAWIMAVSLVR